MKVRIKTWDKMKQEYGTQVFSNTISGTRGCFNDTMESEMPKDRIIEIEKRATIDGCYNYSWGRWGINDWMIEEYIEEDKKKLDEPFRTKRKRVKKRTYNLDI